jgi:hypothetical protein
VYVLFVFLPDGRYFAGGHFSRTPSAVVTHLIVQSTEWT